jgi:hypothetical protein
MLSIFLCEVFAIGRVVQAKKGNLQRQATPSTGIQLSVNGQDSHDSTVPSIADWDRQATCSIDVELSVHSQDSDDSTAPSIEDRDRYALPVIGRYTF